VSKATFDWFVGLTIITALCAIFMAWVGVTGFESAMNSPVDRASLVNTNDSPSNWAGMCILGWFLHTVWRSVTFSVIYWAINSLSIELRYRGIKIRGKSK
jgi:phosphotransferase system  glucose/maltose/N-acetylglucosamine-specific IIC component